ncbi:MAG: hypothetical protein KDC45_13550, partial [Bacteroidetes bacterium]|nr:hypothetical protein [Bacteroidota bacterium]
PAVYETAALPLSYCGKKCGTRYSTPTLNAKDISLQTGANVWAAFLHPKIPYRIFRQPILQ